MEARAGGLGHREWPALGAATKPAGKAAGGGSCKAGEVKVWPRVWAVPVVSLAGLKHHVADGAVVVEVQTADEVEEVQDWLDATKSSWLVTTVQFTEDGPDKSFAIRLGNRSPV